MAPDTEDRGFQAIKVDNFARQSWRQRYDLQPRNQEVQDVHLNAPWRCNLTALSQVYNLYFCAHYADLHIYRPRDLQQRIPAGPDLEFLLPRTPEGAEIRGHIDTGHSHAVNHLVVGQLGDLEIVLLACDDGDVLAYYTHDLYRHAVAEYECRKQHHPKPFIHRNVGKSAWGLAIHASSRMIAVSSNRREISVFVFARRQHAASTIDTRKPSQLIDLSERHHVFKLGESSTNIPSIAFITDDHGYASYILASTIDTTIWEIELDFSASKIPHILTHRTSFLDYFQSHDLFMGWNVLALDMREFIECSTPAEALGTQELVGVFETTADRCPVSALYPKCFFDVSGSIDQMTNKSTSHPTRRRRTDRDPSPGLAYTRLDGDYICEAMRMYAIIGHGAITDSIFDFCLHLLPAMIRSKLHDWKRFTAQGQSIDVATARRRCCAVLETADAIYRRGQPDHHPPYTCAVLRTYNKDIELIPPSHKSPLALNTICRMPLRQLIDWTDLNSNNLISDFANHQRLNMTLKVPELGIVIVACQSGRVLILGLTCFRSKLQAKCEDPIATFRLEQILPTLEQEDDGHRPEWKVFVGVAVSPLQGQEEVSETQSYMTPTARPSLAKHPKFSTLHRRRWRLLMHYSDETILSYELSREKQGDLVIF